MTYVWRLLKTNKLVHNSIIGEYDQRIASEYFGPDGCLSNSADNANLIEETSLVLIVLEPIWQKYCDLIGRADFWVLWALLVLEKASLTNAGVSTGLDIKYQFGRIDNIAGCNAGSGRLPSAQQGLSAITQTMVTQMGLTLEDGGTGREEA